MSKANLFKAVGMTIKIIIRGSNPVSQNAVLFDSDEFFISRGFVFSKSISSSFQQEQRSQGSYLASNECIPYMWIIKTWLHQPLDEKRMPPCGFRISCWLLLEKSEGAPPLGVSS
jgi:hypothetical protein